MKKLFPFLVPILIIPAIFLTSCNKSDSLQQIRDKHNQDVSAEEAARGGHGGCYPTCPSSVPEALDISYSIVPFGTPQHVLVAVDVFYSNPDAAGSFRVVLRRADGIDEPVDIVAAPITLPGQTAMFSLDYDLPFSAFPCILRVNGRPANLECDDRTRRSFEIVYTVSK